MTFTKIAVLTSETSWHISYSKQLVDILKEMGYYAKLFVKHSDIGSEFEVVFILSYFEIIKHQFLQMHQHNIVVHASDLPKGRGWAPLFWQILEGKSIIPIVLFEANEKADDGEIYLKDTIVYEGHELNAEIREKQALKTIEMCLKFLNSYDKLQPIMQTGVPTYYSKRTPLDSELDINRSIEEQFNLLRIVSNEEYPAYFYRDGHKYIIKISEDKGAQHYAKN